MTNLRKAIDVPAAEKIQCDNAIDTIGIDESSAHSNQRWLNSTMNLLSQLGRTMFRGAQRKRVATRSDVRVRVVECIRNRRRRLVTESLESRQLLAADLSLVADIEQIGAPNYIGGLEIGGKFYFRDSSPLYGAELFSYDPITNTKALVADINPGLADSQPGSFRGFVQAGTKLFFTATDATIGRELRWIDTALSNPVVNSIDVNAGASDSDPGYETGFKLVGNKLYFGALTASFGRELHWIDTNSPTPTANTLDIYAGTTGSFAGIYGGFTAVGSKLYFTANSAAVGNELRWIDTNQSVPTLNTVDVYVGIASSNAGFGNGFQLVGNNLYFGASRADGNELRWIDTTLTTPTVRSLDIFAGGSSSDPGSSGGFAAIGNRLYFSAQDSTRGIELRWIDTTLSTPVLQTIDIYGGSPSSNPGFNGFLQVVGNKLYFSARDAATGYELRWLDSSLPTPVINTLDITAGASSSSPDTLTLVGNKLYFSALGATTSTELHWIDTTLATPVANVLDINPGNNPGFPGVYGGISVGADRFYFTAQSSNNVYSLKWVSATQATPTINTVGIQSSSFGSEPGSSVGMASAGGKLFFPATTNFIAGNELRVVDTNGPAGVFSTFDLRAGVTASGPGIYGGFKVVGSKVFFAASDTSGVELRWIDSQATTPVVNTIDIYGGTGSSFPGQYGGFAAIGNRLYFSAFVPGIGIELRWVDTSVTNPVVNTLDINLGSNNSMALQYTSFKQVGNKLYFTAETQSEGVELRWIDITLATPVLNTVDVFTGSGSSKAGEFGGLISVGNKLFFTAKDADNGEELRWIDTTATTPTFGTLNIYSGSIGSMAGQVGGFTAVGNKLYFTARGDNNRLELRWIDAALETPTLNTITTGENLEFSPGQFKGFVAAGTRLYFTAFTSTHGDELRWIDTTLSAPTVQTIDLNPGNAGSSAGQYGGFTLFDDNLYFTALDNQIGFELRWIDTTLATPTVSNLDVNTGISSSYAGRYSGFHSVGTKLYFSADKIGFGTELFAIETAPATLNSTFDSSGNWTITDTDSVGKNNQLTIRREGTNYVVTSSIEKFQNGTTSLSIPQASLTGSLTINAAGGDDTLVLDFAGGNPLPDGGLSFLGASGNDQLLVIGATLDSAIYNATQSASGLLILASDGVNFSGVESLDLTGSTLTDLSIALDPQSQIAGNITSTIAPHTTLSQTQLAFTQGLASLTVGNVTRNFTFFGETAAGDTINLQGAGTGLTAGVSILGQGGADVVNLNGDWTLPANKNFSATVESFNLNANADLITQGTGMITIEADNVELNGTATITGSNLVTIRPVTNQRPIDLGTNTAGSLSLTNAELARITSNMRIGSSTSGAISITNTIAASGRSMRLVSGSGVSGTGAIINSHPTTSGEVIFDQLGQSTYSGLLGGPTAGTNADKLVSIRKAGAGTLTLESANTYLGWTSVDAGILRITNSNALGSTVSGTVVSAGASLQLQNSIAVLNESLTISGGGVGAAGALWNASVNNSWAGIITLAAAATISDPHNNLTVVNVANSGFVLTYHVTSVSYLSGSLTGSGGLTKTGTGQLLLGGTNTYGGVTNILAGQINLGGPATLGDSAAGTIIASGAGLAILTTTPVLDDITVSGNGAYGFGAISGTDGAQLGANVTLVGNTRIAKFNTSSSFVISGNISDGGLGYGLEVRGSETGRAITLAGTNTYTGPTQLIEPVTLNVNGSLTSNVSLVSGARLGGNGTIYGSVTSTGTGAVNPGVSGSGRLTVVGNYSANTIFDIQDDYLTAGPGGDYDQLVVQGSTSQINLGTKTVTFQSASGGTAPLPPNNLTLIKNETASAILPFSNLTAGSQVTLGVAAQARNFNSSYVGGNGRDLVLTGVAPNRAPSGSGGALNVLEDTVRVLTTSDFKFSDPDSGDSLQSVTLTSVPTLGQLYLDLNGNSSFDAATETLAAGSVITVTQLTGNRLRYQPPVNVFGSSFAYFGFRVSDGQLLSNPAGFTIHVASVNDAPFFIAGGNQTIEEDVGPQVVDPWATSISAGPANESTETLSFQVISNSNPQLFLMAPTVSPNGVLSYTSAPNAFGTAIIGVRLQDSGGTTNGGINTSPLQTFTINVTPVVDDVSDILLSNNSIFENAVSGTTIGNFSVAGGGTADFALVSNALDNALFTLTGSTLKSASHFNYELRNNYSIRLQTTIAGDTFTSDFLILINPVNEFFPTLISPLSYSVVENSTLIGILTASDQDLPTPQFIYGISGGADEARFRIVGDSLSFRTPPNFEAPADANGDNFYVVQISVSDGLLVTHTSVTVSVSNTNDAPTSVALSNTLISESLPSGSLVGLLTATDEDAGGTFTFEFSNTIASDNADFQILGNELRTRRQFDYETLADQLLSISVVALDVARARSVPTTLTLSVTDSPERPVAINQSLSMNSNSSQSILLSGNDGNNGTAVAYSVVQQPRFGQISGTAPNLTYTPNSGFAGADEFYFTTSNGALVSYQARVGITVVGTKPTVSFMTPTDSAPESSTARRLLVQLSEPVAAALTIPITVGSGATATARTDVFLPSSITIAAGQNTAELWFIVLNDSLHESNETVVLQIGDSAEYNLGAFPTHTFTIIDDDAPPVFQLNKRSSVVSESTPSILVSLLLSAPLPSAVSIPFTVGGTAQAGLDFNANAIGNSITYAAGETYGYFVIPILDDALVDGTKTITIDFGGGDELWPAGTTAADRRYTLTIRDDDERTVNLASSLGTISENGNSLQLTATVTPAPTQILRVPFSLSGNALRTGPQADYFSSDVEFVFQPGSTQSTITLTIVDDEQIEAAEQLRVDLQAGVDYALGAVRSFIGTIQDNDQATVEFATTELDVWEGDGTRQIVARLNKAVPQEVTVTVQTSISGTRYALAGQDYTFGFTTFVFAANALTSSRTISILTDSLNEDTESVQLTMLPLASSVVKLGTQRSLAVNIKDDDPLVSIVRLAGSVPESDSSVAQFEVRLSSPTNRDVVTSLTFSGSATPGSDYTSLVSNTITIPGDTLSTSRIVSLNIRDDAASEMPESITASLLSVSGGIASPLNSSASIDIIDNESATINIETPSGDIDELPLTRANGLRENRTFDVIFSVSTPVPRNLYIPVEFLGSAVRGLHYNVLSFVETQELYIPAGSTEGVLRLEILNNEDYQGNQEIVVQAVGVNSPAVLPATGLVRFFTILDDEYPGSPFPPVDSPVPGVVYQGEYGPSIGSISPNSTDGESCSPSIEGDNSFSICTTVAMAGSNGPLDGATAFFDMNFNGILDFVDANNNLQRDTNELAEPSTLTAKDGSFSLSLADYDFDNDGFFVPADGRFVMQGGVDISTGLGWPIPLVAPVGIFSLTPVSTLVESLVRTQNLSVPAAIARTTAALGLTGYDLTSGSSIYQVLSNDGAAARAYSAHVQLYAAVLGLANYLAAVSGQDVAGLGAQAFSSVAALINTSNATLDLTQAAVIEAIGDHLLDSQGIVLDDANDLARVSSIIALGIQKLASVELVSSQSDAGQQFLLQINRIKKVIQGELPNDLRSLTSPEQLAELEIEYSSTGFDTKIAGSVAAVTVPPVAFINSAELLESSSGTSVMVFSVTLNGTHDYVVSLNYASHDISATAGSDYVAKSGILTWEAGDNLPKTIEVIINGDMAIEADERLRILLSQPDGLVIRNSEGLGTVINDDTVRVGIVTQAAANELVAVTSASTLDLIVNGVPTQTGNYSQGTSLFITGQPDKRDALTIDFSANTYRADQISFNGGSGTTADSFRALAGVFETLTYAIGGAGNGVVEFTPTIAAQKSISSLNDVEAIDLDVSSVNTIVVRVPSTIGELIIEDIDGGRKRLHSNDNSFIPLEFKEPNVELRIIKTSANTTVTIDSTDLAFVAKIQQKFADVTRPISSMTALPQVSLSLSMTLMVNGIDPSGSDGPATGISQFDIYVSSGSGFSWLATVPASSPNYVFTGQANTDYWFRTVARDVAGNVELKSLNDAFTRIGDIVPPSSVVSSAVVVPSSSGLLSLQLTGAKFSGSPLTHFDVYVAVDSGAYVMVGTASAVASGSGTYSGALVYQGIADGLSHTYRLYSRARDSRGNVESAPAAADVSVTATFASASLTATAIDVQQGVNQRSYIRSLDILFSSPTGVSALANASRIKLERFDLAATSVAVGQGTAVSAPSFSVNGNKIALDFGATGLGGLRQAGNGFYRVLIDGDGNGSFADAADKVFEFYRLFGDANGDGVVNIADTNLVTAQLGRTGNSDGDLDGSGIVNSLDRTHSTQQRGKMLSPSLFAMIDD